MVRVRVGVRERVEKGGRGMVRVREGRRERGIGKGKVG